MSNHKVKSIYFLMCLLLPMMVSTGCLRPMPGYEIYDLPPDRVPARTIKGVEGVSMLWVKELELENPHKAEVQFFVPNKDNVVFWKPQDNVLTALDVVTGNTVWETEVPDHGTMRLFDDRFYVLSYEWFDVLEEAPVISDKEIPDCSWGGETSMLTINPHSGEIIWSYTYIGVGNYYIYFDEQNIYLTGSGDHGASNSIAQIDALTGNIVNLECYRWPNKQDILSPPNNEGVKGVISVPYTVIREKEDLEWELERGKAELIFWAEDNRFDIWDGNTKNIVGSVTFQGFELNPWEIDVAMLEDIAVIYFEDSNQLFSLQLNK